MYHFLYKTTNNINGKYYIGAHTTDNVNDNYMGSGVALVRAIEKYGKENFSREIISFYEDYQTLYDAEKIEVGSHFLDEECYNMKPGGRGGWYTINASDIHSGANNVMNRCPDIRDVVTKKTKETKLKNREHYAEIARNNGRKSADKLRGTKPSEATIEKVRLCAKRLWSERYEYMRDVLSNFFELTSPTGEKIVTNRLQEYCISNNLTYVSIWNTSRTHMIVKKGRSKGWSCRKI